MNFTLWLPLAAVCLLGAMSPGPSLAMIIRHTLAGRRRDGLAAAWSHATGIAMYALLTVAGLAVILVKARLVFSIIAICGACYLLWLGLQALRSSGSSIQLQAGSQSTSVLKAARDGFAISLLNPKILLFFIALFSPFVAHEQALGHQLLVLTPWVVDGSWYTLVVLLLSQGPVLGWMRQHSRWVDRATGCILVGIGAEVLISTFFL